VEIFDVNAGQKMITFSFFYYLTVGFFLVTVFVRLTILWRRRYRLHLEMMREQNQQNHVPVAVPTTAYPGSFAATGVTADAVAVIVDEPGSYFGSRGFHVGGRSNNFGNHLPPLASATCVGSGNDNAVIVTASAAYEP
jgi:hypothetical protein